MAFYLDPVGGDDTQLGLSHDTAWKTLGRLQSHLREQSQAHVAVLLRAGQTFAGSIDALGPFALDVGTYDGDAPATIRSGRLNAVNYGCPDPEVGRLRLRNLKLEGAGGPVEDLHAGVRCDARAQGSEIEHVEAVGYTFAGVLLQGELRGTTLRKLNLHGNANGLFVAGFVGGPTVRGLGVLDCDFWENSLLNPQSCGFGASICGAEGIEVAYCRARRNGWTASGGGSGLMLYLCQHAQVRHSDFLDNKDPNPETGDGQGCVIDDSWDVEVSRCEAHRNGGGGIQIHDEFRGTSPRHVTVWGCAAADNVVCYSHQGGAGNVLWDNNEAYCSSRDGAYRVALDLHLPAAGTRFTRNRFEAQDGAVLFQAAGGLGRGVTFHGDEWRSRSPSFLVEGKGYATLAAALEAAGLGAAVAAARVPVANGPRHSPRNAQLRELLAGLSGGANNLAGVA